jgi:hypothetical protein
MRRPSRRAVTDWARIIVILILIGVVLYRVQLQDHRLDALAAALEAEQQALEERGETPVAPEPDELIDDPDAEIPAGPPGPEGPSGPPGPAPSEAALDAAVARHFAEHPYQGELSAAELAAAFAALLAENPGALNDQVYAALADYLAANPPPAGPPGTDGEDGADGANGADGAQGEPGRPPTKEEIRAEIEAYIDEYGLPICPPEAPPGPLTVVTPGGAVDIIACILTDQGETLPD